MATLLQRWIVSAVILSQDNQILLGQKDLAKGGVYLDKWHLPGGGIEPGETELAALQREIQEEVGLDIQQAEVRVLDTVGRAVTLKQLPSGEKVPCRMEFMVYQVQLSQPATEIKTRAGDDFAVLRWVPRSALHTLPLTPPSVALGLRLGWLTQAQALTQRQFLNADQEPVAYEAQPLGWRISAYAIVMKADQVLLVKHEAEKLYDVMGGGIEFGETIEDGLHREAREEAGARIKIGPLLHAEPNWFYHPADGYCQTVQLFYAAELVGELEPATDSEMVWAGWVPLAEVGTQYQLPPVVELVIAQYAGQHRGGEGK